VDVFNILSFVFLAFAVLLIFNFTRNSINSRLKDIGILRSLGAGSGDIAKIFIIEGLLFAGVMSVMASFAAWGGFIALDKYFISQLGYIAENYTLVSFGVRQIAIMAGISVSAVAVSTFLPIFWVSRKQPVDVIRTGQQ
jgi:lipoprotein-releasing system permease protein